MIKSSGRAHIIVFGNEKGGSGKTTSAMHVIASLLKLGFTVACIDLDYRQQSLSRYIENRSITNQKSGFGLVVPASFVLSKSNNDSMHDAIIEEEEKFLTLVNDLKSKHDFIVIDTPGSDSFLSRLAHSYADTIVTPINDSFIDVDLLGKIDAADVNNIKPGIYSAMVWEQKLKRAARNKEEIKWIVVRNRLSSLDAINKRNIEDAIVKLSKKFGFKIAPGFCDRVIFKELFLYGLTLHDVDKATQVRMNASAIAARQELRDFLIALDIVNIREAAMRQESYVG